MDALRRPPAAADAEQIAKETRWLADVAGGGPRGDAAMRALFNAYQPKFLKSLRWRGFSVEFAVEVTQTAWLDVIRKAGAFPVGVTPSCWLWRFVDNEFMDAVRKRARGARLVSDNDERLADEVDKAMSSMTASSPETAHALAATHRCVQDAFTAFKRRHADEAWLLYLRHVEDCTLEQIAECRRSTVHAASQFLAQARLKFRPLLQPCLALRPD